MNIEKKLFQIWIGPNPAPLKWMYTWKQFHPSWEYNIFKQSDLDKRRFKNQHLIDHYMKHQIYAGVSDLIRYELIFEMGGFWPEADFICIKPIDNLFVSPISHCYTCYENETIRPGFVQPIFAANPNNLFLEQLITELNQLSSSELSSKPWKSTGNEWLSKMIPKYQPDITIFPSYFFIPEHYSIKAPKYYGISYAKHMWGSTSSGTNYKQGT